MKKYIIITLILITLTFTSSITVRAINNIIWSQDRTSVYKFQDKDLDVTCYVAVSTNISNETPAISCVK